MVVWVHEYVCYMCGMMWDYKCIVMYVHGYACTVCVIWWSQIDIYMCDMILCYDLIYADFGRAAWLEFLHVVLNTTCNCIWRYAMRFGIYKVLLLWIYNAVMCVYVDNYVDNSLICVDNFLLQMQHFYELFWKYYIFVYFRTLSLIISRLLSLSLCFVILL